MPMLGLGYLAAIAKRRGHEVNILDCKKEAMNYNDFKFFINKNHFDLIGFQVFTYDIDSLKRHIDIIKGLNKDALLIIGGAHPSGDPAGSLEYIKGVDYVFKGEAEIGFGRFLEAMERQGKNKLRNNSNTLSNIPGLVYRNADGKILENKNEYIENLDYLDFPAWELMNPNSYPEAPHGAFARGFPTAPLMITRGCPHQCTFCAGKTITGDKIRRRSIDNVWEEMLYLIDRFKVKEFLIEDENFTLHQNLLKDFCLRIINSKHKISWSLPSGARLETFNGDNIKLMQDSGCYSIAVGVEFGSQRIHDITKKRLNIGLIKEKIRLFLDSKIKITGFFLMGIPGETKAEMLSTIDLALRLGIDRAQFNNFMPLPGSELWNQLKSNNKLGSVKWDSFYVHDVAFVSGTVSATELKHLQRLAYLRFYLRRRIILRILKEIKSFRHLKMLLKRFIDALR